MNPQIAFPKSSKHLDLWDVRRKPPARANGPPTESFINYDQSSSPDADDYERFEKQDGLPILEFLQNFLRRKLNIKSTACRIREKRVTYSAFRALFRAHF